MDPLGSTPALSVNQTVAHAVGLLQKADDSSFVRWADTCDDIFMKDSHGNTLLHWAAAFGQLTPLKYLMNSGLDKEARNDVGATPLLCAAASCRNPGSVIAFLLRSGASMDAKNAAGDDVFSLLEKRDLGKLVDLFQMMRKAMDCCPRLFSSSGFDTNGPISFDSEAPTLGTERGLAQQVSTVRFKSVSEQTTKKTSSVAAGSPGGDVRAIFGDTGSGRWRWGLTSGATEADLTATHTTPAASASEVLLMQLMDKEAVARNRLRVEYADEIMPIVAELLRFTTWLYNNLASEVYTTDDDEDNAEGEAANRGFGDVEGERGKSDEDDEETPRFEAPVDPVVAVFGERHDADGQRVLLVQWRKEEGEPDADLQPSADELEWVLLSDIDDSACVRHYVSRFDRTYSDADLQEDNNSSFGLERTSSQGGALDDEERDELERMLGMIPRRQSSADTTSRRSNRTTMNSSQQRYPEQDDAAHSHEHAYANAYGHANNNDDGVHRTGRPLLHKVAAAPNDEGGSRGGDAGGSHGVGGASANGVYGGEHKEATADAASSAVGNDRFPTARHPLASEIDDECLLTMDSDCLSTADDRSSTTNPVEPISTAAPSPIIAQCPQHGLPKVRSVVANPLEADKRPVVWKRSKESSSQSTPTVAEHTTGLSAVRAVEGLASSSSQSNRFTPSSVRRVGSHPLSPDEAESSPPTRTAAEAVAPQPSKAASSASSTPAELSPKKRSNCYQLSQAEQLSYQKFLYQSAMEHLRARNGGFAALRQK